MKLQKQTLIGLLATLELARDPSRTLSAGEIADTYGISVNHLAKVLRDLGRAGLVEAVRGVGGGYRFAGNAKRTSLYDVIHLFGDIVGDAGEIPGPSGRASAPHGDTDIGKALASVLRELDEIAIATFKSISLATLLKNLPRVAQQEGGTPDAGARKSANGETSAKDRKPATRPLAASR